MGLVAPETWVPQGVDDLENAAWEALRETRASVCITAGAGAGKTEFLAQKAAFLLQTGICREPRRILAISFKRDAAATLSERVSKRCEPQLARRFVSMTFDAFAKGLVDQFRLALPEKYRPPSSYQIATPGAADINAFLARVDRRGLNADQFLSKLGMRRLMDDAQEIGESDEAMLDAYWDDQYGAPAEPLLTFLMINRLAEYLLRTNARVRRAVQTTYPFVFLDEFQDAQGSQFRLLLSAFHRSATKFTAVGDRKQRIMGWAGAMDDSFAAFTRLFEAKQISLLANWRSHRDLVLVSQIVAERLDEHAPKVVARAERSVDGQVAAIWKFQDQKDEVQNIARWVAAEVAAGHVEAHDIALLVRARADVLEQDLGPAFSACGLVVRNLARKVGDVAIEETLTEQLTRTLLPFLRLGAQRRDPDAWSDAIAILQWLHEATGEDELGAQRVTVKAEVLTRRTRAFMKSAPPPGAAGRLVELLLAEMGTSIVRRASPAYGRDADFQRVLTGFRALLEEAVVGARTWTEALDVFEGKHQVPLLTVHKSKGMEFHTIVFFGLDNSTWWSLKPTNTEELNSFFVALTRAKQRAFFTSCSGRGGPIAWLEELLGDTLPRLSTPTRTA